MSKLSKYMDLKLTNLFERGFRKNKEQIFKKIVSAASHEYLTTHLSGNMVIPYNAWSISPQGMMVIVNHVLINNVKTIVEFGTGISTVFLNNLSVKNNLDLKIISVDHDANWQKVIREKYKAVNVEYICAPLTGKQMFKSESISWYDTELLKPIDKKQIDFIIVDAPIGSGSLYERAGAFEFFKEELHAPGFSCYLDDTCEPPLKEIMLHYYPNAKLYPDFGIAGLGNAYEIEPVIFTK